ncbi:MAG: response regulator [SAR324 cluster bacterium]|nr:response regulator [SAR324 cluster bacterium]MBL7035830.1 response regulator [SAR324 cluster bacterium]
MTSDTEMNIMVVDSFATTRRLIVNILYQLGYNNVTEADEGTLALARLKSELYDFVIIDWKLSKMSGLELLKHLREDPALKHIPVLICLDEALPENIVAATKAGINDYIIMPFEKKMFSEKLRKIFKQHQSCFY